MKRIIIVRNSDHIVIQDCYIGDNQTMTAPAAHTAEDITGRTDGTVFQTYIDGVFAGGEEEDE